VRWAILDTTVYIGHWEHELYEDALIALTARRHGATVVTANHTDFELLSREIGLSVFPV